MKLVAFIPARCGSKSIPKKNIKLFFGKPLIYWSLKALENTGLVDRVVVATDCDEVTETVESMGFNKVKIYRRKTKNAQDFSSTESVMLEYISASKLDGEVTFMLVQLTSPFTRSEDFEKGIKMFDVYDSILSCARSKRFMWDKGGIPINYDLNNRPRRQEFEGMLIENGAFYISYVSDIIKYENRLSGKIGICEMPEYTVVEIDEEEDWIMAEQLMKKHKNKPVIDISKIKIFLSDVDGVLTDAGMYYSEKGDELKKFCTYDGMGFRLLQKQGIKVGVLTSEDRELNRRRAKKLNLDFDFHGVSDKLKFVKDLCQKENLGLDQISYIGDDINCHELLSQVGLAFCPKNSVDKIKNIPGVIEINKNGGDGAVRQLVEKFFL